MGPQQGGGSAVAPNWACLPHLPRWPLLHCPGQAVAGTPIHQGLSKAEEGEAMLHGIHCIPSGCILPHCMEYTAFNHNGWNPMHSIGMLWAMLQKIHCIQSGCTGPRCMDSTAFNWYPLRCNAWNPLHSMTLHGIHCIQSGCFGACFIKSTAFNHDAWNPLHSIMLHKIH